MNTVIKLVKNLIFKKVYLPLKPTWRSCFFLFHSHNPKPKQNHQISRSRAKTRSTRSHGCVKYRGNIICIKRNTDVNTGDLKILHKKIPNKVDFPDVIIIFPKIWCGLPSTLFLTGELWLLRFIWHHDLRVTHCQSSAMTFVFMQYSFCNSFRQGLIALLLTLSKAAEAIIHNRLSAHFTENNVIAERQAAYLKGNSTIQQLLCIINLIRKSWSKGCITQGIFLDISAAFDKCWHKGLLEKLKQAKVKSKCHTLF